VFPATASSSRHLLLPLLLRLPSCCHYYYSLQLLDIRLVSSRRSLDDLTHLTSISITLFPLSPSLSPSLPLLLLLLLLPLLPLPLLTAACCLRYRPHSQPQPLSPIATVVDTILNVVSHNTHQSAHLCPRTPRLPTSLQQTPCPPPLPSSQSGRPRSPPLSALAA